MYVNSVCALICLAAAVLSLMNITLLINGEKYVVRSKYPAAIISPRHMLKVAMAELHACCVDMTDGRGMGCAVTNYHLKRRTPKRVGVSMQSCF